MTKLHVPSRNRSRRMWGATIVAAITAGSAAFGGSPVSAAAQEGDDYWCYGCFVLAVGPQADTGKVSVLLHDPNGGIGGARGREWFDARKSPDRILTTALAALTSGKTVTVNVASKTKDSAIDRMYLENAPRDGGS
ncbi:hypothetical protein [Actinoplanes xinjiangensis]|uniref:hypothetical protein n=1 Tax=Actinoplanes xinjiangensis TaxID=512350 RepID=UPI00341C82A5